MEQYSITGMSCAACSTRVEKAVKKVEGVDGCAVSLLTNSMGVEGNVSPELIIKAVEEAGYGASLKSNINKVNNNSVKSEYDDMLKDKETPVLKKRLIYSLGFLVVLMYVSMGHMMWKFPLPAFFSENHIAIGILQLLLSVIIMVINQKFFVSGFKSLIHKAPNMDTLVALGSASAFVYSTYALFMMTDAQQKGDMSAVVDYMHEFYFESAAMILTLITLGKMLEARSKGKTTDAIKSLMKMSPKTATVIKDNIETVVDIEEVLKGDIFIVKPGENIPADGIIIEGESAINESALTGESIPVDKSIGDKVSAATLNQTGFIKCEALRVGEDTALSQIIKMVSDAAATKAPIAKVADKVSGVFVPAVIVVAVVTILIWLAAGYSLGFALARGISVLVISCPCALGLATPVAIMVGSGVGAKNGIMFKTAISLEEAGKTQIVVLDKTGTITSGEPKVTDVLSAENIEKKHLLKLANSLEIKSEHPLAKAVTEYAREKEIEAYDVSQFEALPGNGLKALYNGKIIYGGNAEFINTKVRIPDEMMQDSIKLSNDGKTPLFFAEDNKFAGIIAVADTIKSDSPDAIKELQNMGIYVAMLTGDNEMTAQAIGRQAGVDKVIAGVFPDGKEKVIRTFKEMGKVMMVGDGINDAPALTRADIGVAIGAGTDVAIDAADIVLMKNSLKDVAAAIRLSRYTLKNIHQNLFWAFFYNIIGIPLAAGVWISVFGWKLNPMFGAAAMSLSSFCVVTNALRLNLVDIYNIKNNKINKNALRAKLLKTADGSADLFINRSDNLKINNINLKMEDETMTKTMKIEGMMCGHCEARVKKCLEALEQVKEATVSHEEGTAIVSLSQDISDDMLTKTVEDQDYKVISIN